MEGHRWLSVTSAYNSNPWSGAEVYPFLSNDFTSGKNRFSPSLSVLGPQRILFLLGRAPERSSISHSSLAKLLSLMARRANRNDYNNDHTYLSFRLSLLSARCISPHLDKNITLGREEREGENGNKPVCARFQKDASTFFEEEEEEEEKSGRFERKAAARGFSRGQDINRQTLLSSHTHAPSNQRRLSIFCSHNFRLYSVTKRIFKVG